MHNTTQNDVVLSLLDGLLNVKLASIGLILQIGLSIRELQVVQEVLEQLNALQSHVAYLKDGAYNLALHLPVYQYNVLLFYYFNVILFF